VVKTREQGTEEGGIGIEHAMCGSVRISRRDTLDENLVEIEGEASVLLEYSRFALCPRAPLGRRTACL
jgi:hypothetical protein